MIQKALKLIVFLICLFAPMVGVSVFCKLLPNPFSWIVGFSLFFIAIIFNQQIQSKYEDFAEWLEL
jgi:uncharacterized membrane protein